MNKTANVFYKILYCVIALAFFKLLLDILGRDFVPRTVGQSAFRILQWIVGIVILFFVYKGIKRTEKIWEKYGTVVLAVYVVVLFAAQLLFGNELRVNPLYDYSSLFHGATDWVVTGTFERFYDYYYYYPNNIGPMMLLMIAFQMAAKVGFYDFYMVGMIINCVLCAGMVIATYAVCKKMFSASEAVFSLVLYAVYPPMYLMGAVFYTDQLTMIFPVLLYLIYLYLDKCQDKVRMCVWSILMAVVTVVGYILKPTVFIMLIAICAALFLSAQWKKLAMVVAIFVAVYISANLLLDSCIYDTHLSKQVAEQMNTPLETWVMMGLNDNPGFSPDDTEFSRSIKDPQERKEKVRGEIVNRVKDFGFAGMLEHLKNKGILAFSDGSFELSYTFLFGFQKETELADTVTLLGDNYDTYWDSCSSLWYVYLIFCVFYMVKTAIDVFRKKTAEHRWLPVSLAAFGLLCFLLLWEVHARYMVNYFSCFILMTVCGVVFLNKCFAKKDADLTQKG